MATIVNTPGSTSESGMGVGMIVSIIVVLALIVLFFVYGLPALRNSDTGSSDINVTVPNPVGGTGNTQ